MPFWDPQLVRSDARRELQDPVETGHKPVLMAGLALMVSMRRSDGSWKMSIYVGVVISSAGGLSLLRRRLCTGENGRHTYSI